MLEIRNLSKIYKENAGNFNININVPDGKCFAIIGPNGAGKTTLVKQILGLIKPDGGKITVNNLDSWTKRKEIMMFTGYIPGEIALYNDLSGLKFLKIISSLKKNVEWDFVEDLIEHFDLDIKTKIKKMSKGMRQKVAIIAAFMNKPSFIILDEPTSGLDPVMQNQFNLLINQFRKKYNCTILICSHIFEEVAQLADTICFIKKGHLIEQYELKSKDINEINDKFKKLYLKEGIF